MKTRFLALFPPIFFIFVALQSTIDLLTSLATQHSLIPVSPGMLLRFGFLFLGIIYLLLKHHDVNRFLLFASYTWIGVALIKLIMNQLMLGTIGSGAEITTLIKISYSMLLLPIAVTALESAGGLRAVTEKYSRAISFSILIILVVMVLALLTGTSGNSYSYGKAGLKGWFYAANELGSILAISMPALMLLLYKSSIKQYIIGWLLLVAGFATAIVIGTKVGYLATLILLVMSVLYSVMDFFHTKERRSLLTTLISLILLATIILGSSKMTAFTNTVNHYDAAKEGINLDSEKKLKPDSSDELENVILSGRNIFLNAKAKEFKNASINQKLFGLTDDHRKGQFVAKQIEMDFFDIFFETGIIGFLVYFSTIFYVLFKILVYFLRNFTAILDYRFYFQLVMIALGLAIGFISGHVMTAPAVAIFLVLPLAYSLIYTEDKNKDGGSFSLTDHRL